MDVDWTEFLPELWGAVCTFLRHKDICNFRLICKSLSQNVFVYPLLFRKASLRSYVEEGAFYLLNTSRVLTLRNYSKNEADNKPLLEHLLTRVGVISLRIDHLLMKQILTDCELYEQWLLHCRRGRIKMVEVIWNEVVNDEYSKMLTEHSRASRARHDDNYPHDGAVEMLSSRVDKLFFDHVKSYYLSFFKSFCGDDLMLIEGEPLHIFFQHPRYRFYCGDRGSILLQIAEKSMTISIIRK